MRHDSSRDLNLWSRSTHSSGIRPWCTSALILIVWSSHLQQGNMYQNCSLMNLNLDWDRFVIDSKVIPRSQAKKQNTNCCRDLGRRRPRSFSPGPPRATGSRPKSVFFPSTFHNHRKSTKRPLSLGNDGLSRGGFLTGWQRPKCLVHGGW